ncbi:MAG: hypothetical protein IT330_17330 [Anaerolineae bacterium]|nr:hypothetical protein [Anaerolineae bacterium]
MTQWEMRLKRLEKAASTVNEAEVLRAKCLALARWLEDGAEGEPPSPLDRAIVEIWLEANHEHAGEKTRKT